MRKAMIWVALMIPLLVIAEQLEFVSAAQYTAVMDSSGAMVSESVTQWQEGGDPILICAQGFHSDTATHRIHYDTLYAAMYVFRLPDGFRWDNNASAMFDYPITATTGCYYLEYRAKANQGVPYPTIEDGSFTPWTATNKWFTTIVLAGNVNHIFRPYYSNAAQVRFMNSVANGGAGVIPSDEAISRYMLIVAYTIMYGPAYFDPSGGACGPVHIINPLVPPSSQYASLELPEFSDVDAIEPTFEDETISFDVDTNRGSGATCSYTLLCDFHRAVLDTICEGRPEKYETPVEFIGKADHLAFVDETGRIYERVALSFAVDVVGEIQIDEEY